MEDIKAKQRVESFYKIQTKDYVRQCEKFHVSLRKQRFIKRSNKKRGITFDKKGRFLVNSGVFEDLTDEDDTKAEYWINSQEAVDNPDCIKFEVTVEDLRSFRAEAHEAKCELNQGTFEIVTQAMNQLFEVVDVFFAKSKLTFVEEKELYGLILRMRIFISAVIYAVKLEQLDPFIPDLINLLDHLIPYPEHLKELLSILINISTKDGIGEDFMYKKYEFLRIMQNIFEEYPFDDKVYEIHQNAYQLLANLAVEKEEIRDEIVEAKFIEYIAYLLESREIFLRPCTINRLAFAVKNFTDFKIKKTSILERFECIVNPLEALLYQDDSDTVE